MRIAIIGAGNVGTALGRGWARADHSIAFGVSGPTTDKSRALAEETGATVANNRIAAGDADVIVMSVPWGAVQVAVAALGPLDGRVVIDATNPLNFGPDGMSLAVGFSDSGAETIQRLASGASVFKTMNQVGFHVMDRAREYPLSPTMFVAGDDTANKPVVMGLVADLGFTPLDCGSLKMARYLEPYAMVWINQVVVQGIEDSRAFVLMPRNPEKKQ
ncbi:MAG: NADPH-dependent F420 reductase [Propionivibrio sp.]